MARETYICRSSSTGKYHRTNSPNITYCNYSGQVRGGHNRAATEKEIAEAAPEMFCKKCFHDGKPA